MAPACPICGVPLGQDLDCAQRHRQSTEAYCQTLRDSVQALTESAVRLRELALRMDKRGEPLAAQVHEQALMAELRAQRMKEALAKQPQWPPRPIEA